MRFIDTEGEYIVENDNGHIHATKWSLGEAIVAGIIENTPFSMASLAYRELRGDPSFKPGGVDWYMGAISLALSGGFNIISGFTKEANTIKNIGNIVGLTATGIPSLLLGAESAIRITNDTKVFKAATTKYVTYKGKKYKLANYVKKIRVGMHGKIIEYEDKDDIEMNTELYNSIKDKKEAFNKFSDWLKELKDAN